MPVGQLGHLVDGGDEAGHVGRPAHRDEPDLSSARLQRMLDRLQVDVAVLGEADHHVPAAVAPGEKVCVVLHLGHEHRAPVEASLLGGDPVQRVSGALDEDDDLRALVDAQESRRQPASVLVCLGRQA
jgi:hypothetical protein